MILIAGATSNVGRRVVSQLLGTGAAVRALTCNPHDVGLPDNVVRDDLSVLDTLGACLDGVEAVFLVWSFSTVAPAFLDAVNKHARRIIYLLSEGVGDDLEQQTDTITGRIAAKLAA
jgi:uncharacterized protein YbjT (DUF2867 family)